MAVQLLFEGIGKRFGRAVALDSLSLTIEAGEIFGFLGPNGAGKTTAIYLAMGLLRASSGRGELLGQQFGQARAARARVGYVPDAPVFFAGTALGSVMFAGRLNAPDSRQNETRLRARAIELLRWMDLPLAGKDARKFSRGMQQRLALAQALVNEPDLLVLDEPTSALDPPAVALVREALVAARARGAAVFFSSHQLDEVELLCDRAAFLEGGQLLHSGSMGALLTEGARARVVLRGVLRESAFVQRWEAALTSGSGTVARGDLAFEVPVNEQRALLEQAWVAGAELVGVNREHRTLADLFAARRGSGSADVEKRTKEELR